MASCHNIFTKNDTIINIEYLKAFSSYLKTKQNKDNINNYIK